MAAAERPSTPPRRPGVPNPKSPITPEQIRRMEEARLRSKALSRMQQDATASSNRSAKGSYLTLSSSSSSSSAVAGQKRPHSATVSRSEPATRRDARRSPPRQQQQQNAPQSNNGLATSADTGIRAARKFQKYVEYDLSKMRDTKGGFMSLEDDPHNRALHAPPNPNEPVKPAHMTLQEWERQQLHTRLRNARAGPYEPGIPLSDPEADAAAQKKCRECGAREIDWQWEEALGCRVCGACKERFPEKYSLLTKTEAREDYLLTDPELRDAELLPHLERPNPHKSSWNNMMLYLRYQVEEYAFSDRKWGSAERLDEEFERRTREAKARKEKKFRSKLDELKKRTRVEAYKRARGGGGGEFGDTIGKGRHEHEWGRAVEDAETGMTKKACVECGMEVEELEL